MPLVLAPVQSQNSQSLTLVPPFCPCRMLVGTDHTSINEMDLPIDLAFGLRFFLEGRQHLLPQTRFAPMVKPS